MTLRWLTDLIKKLMSGQFYGTLELHFQAGKLTHAKRIENLKPPREATG